MKYHYSMVIQWSEEDQLFLVHLPEFSWQQFHTHGKFLKFTSCYYFKQYLSPPIIQIRVQYLLLLLVAKIF